MKECEINPTAPECQSASGRQSVGFQGNSFNITGNDKASHVPGSMNDGKGGGANADSPGQQNRSDIAGIIGTELGEATGKGSTAITGAPGAASYSGKGVGNPGGSGGASSKGAAPPGGRPPRTGGKPSPGSDSRGVKVKYDGDGSGWKSGAYGSSRRRKKKPSSNSNPFAKLFGDKKKKDGKGGILNFRTPSSALNKKGGLFQRVSSRYRQVEKEKRLLKYVQK